MFEGAIFHDGLIAIGLGLFAVMIVYGIYLQLRHALSVRDLFDRTSRIHKQAIRLMVLWVTCSTMMLIGLGTYPE